MKYGSIEEGMASSKVATEIDLTINPDDPFGEAEIFDNDDFWEEVSFFSLICFYSRFVLIMLETYIDI